MIMREEEVEEVEEGVVGTLDCVVDGVISHAMGVINHLDGLTKTDMVTRDLLSIIVINDRYQ